MPVFLVTISKIQMHLTKVFAHLISSVLWIKTTASPAATEEWTSFWLFLLHQVHSARRKGVWIQQQLPAHHPHQVGQSPLPAWASGADHPHQLHSDPCRSGGTAARAGGVPWKTRPGGSEGESRLSSILEFMFKVCLDCYNKHLLCFLSCPFLCFPLFWRVSVAGRFYYNPFSPPQ